MPNMNAYLDTVFRVDGYKPRLYLSVMSGGEVLNADVTADGADGDLSIAISINSGNIANVKRGQRVVVETAGGAHKGTLSVRYGGTNSTTVLNVREYSPGEVQVTSGDVVRVYEDLVIVDKLVSADERFEPDHLAYTNEHGVWKPLALSGGWCALRLNASGQADFYGRGGSSTFLDPSSSSAVTHLWSGTGSPTFVLGTVNTDASPVMRWTAAGSYLVTHTVTDTDNSATYTQYIRVRVHGDNDLPYELTLEQLQGDAENGFSFTANLFENTAFADLHDALPVILWSEDTIPGGVALGSGTTGRSHIIASGWLRRDESYANANPAVVRFEVVSSLTRVMELPNFSKYFIQNASDALWSDFNPLTIRLAIIALIRDYTNLNEQFDVYFNSTFVNGALYELELEKSNPRDQLKEIIGGRSGRLAADRTCNIEVQKQLWAYAIGDRSGMLTTATLTTDDVIRGSLKINRDHNPPLETFRLRGISVGSTEESVLPLFARYPATPARGNQLTTEEKAILDDAADRLAECALRGAWFNHDFFDANGVKYYAPEIEFKLPLVYARMFQFYEERVQLDFDGSESGGREIALSTFDWTVLSVTEDHRSLTCTLTLRALTHAPPEAAADDTPTTDVELPPYVPPTTPPITSPVLIPGTLPSRINKMALMGVSACARTTNFQSASPYYTSHTWASIGATGTFLLWVPNGFDFGSGWVITTAEVGYFNISTLAYAVKHTFAATSSFRSADASFGVPNHFVVVSYYAVGGTKLLYTTDNSSFSETTTVNATTGGGTPRSGCYVSPLTAGLVYTSAITGAGTSSGYRSTDYGATIASMTNPTFVSSYDGNLCIHVPYHDNGDEKIVYVGQNTSTPGSHKTYRINGVTQTDITPDIAGTTYAPNSPRDCIATFVFNRQRVLLVGSENTGNTFGIFLSNSAGDAWTTIATGGNYQHCALSGDDMNTCWIWGASNYMQQGVINGNAITLYDKSGNLSDYSIGTIVAIAGY